MKSNPPADRPTPLRAVDPPYVTADEEVKYVTQESLQQVVEHFNRSLKAIGESFGRAQTVLTSIDVRLRHLEGASPADRVVAAAIAARVESEALVKAAEIAKGLVQDAFAKLAEQDKARAEKEVAVNGSGAA